MGRTRKWEGDYNTFLKIKNGSPVEKKQALEYLFKKYEEAIWKQKHKLDSTLYENKIFGLDTEDYFSKVYATPFLNAVNSIKLDRIKPEKQKTWTFWAQLNGYLMSFNRDEISHHIKVLKNELSISSYSNNEDISDGNAQDYVLYQNASSKLQKSPEDEYFQKCEDSAFWKAVEVSRKLYSPLENKIWSLREQNLKKKEICEKANIEMKDLNKSLKNMKTILVGNIQKYKKLAYD